MDHPKAFHQTQQVPNSLPAPITVSLFPCQIAPLVDSLSIGQEAQAVLELLDAEHYQVHIIALKPHP